LRSSSSHWSIIGNTLLVSSEYSLPSEIFCLFRVVEASFCLIYLLTVLLGVANFLAISLWINLLLQSEFDIMKLSHIGHPFFLSPNHKRG
jgi:hypothetical protein